MAVSIGSERTVAAGSEHDEPAQRRYTHVWVNRDGRWQLVARHAGRAP